MNTEQETYIRESFKSMRNKEDLLALLNYVKPILYGKNTYPFELRQLTYHANPALNNSRYYVFTIPKKSGSLRTIHAPCKGLKVILKCLNPILQVVFEPLKSATGFVKGRSIVDNARLHIAKRFVYNMDLKDFFPSIDRGRIVKRLTIPPFSLNNQLALIVGGLCCHTMAVERKFSGIWQTIESNVLPQGAPTSPSMTNIICHRMDRRLSGAARKYNVTYSRYADDITFSANRNRFRQNSTFLKEVFRIISEENYYINDSKTRLQSTGFSQEVTGLVVNEKINVKRRYVRELRLWIHLWEKHGYEKASEIFLQRYSDDKGHIKKGKPEFQNVLGGKLKFLKMVKGEDDPIVLNFLERYYKLKDQREKESDLMNVVAELILSQDLDGAIKLFDSIKKDTT